MEELDQPPTAHTFPLGRLVQFDERSRQFPIRGLLGAAKKPRSYTWKCDVYLDQGQTSSCVGHSWTHEAAARPVVASVNSQMAFAIYRRAQQLDEWPGEEPSYEGSSIIAGAKAMQEAGHIGEYRWAFGIDDLIMAVGYAGPAVVGTAWYEGMFDPDPSGVIKPTGRMSGGHAYLVNGISLAKQQFRIHNSWGQRWGIRGDGFISFADMDSLLRQQGEACIPVRRIKK